MKLRVVFSCIIYMNTEAMNNPATMTTAELIAHLESQASEKEREAKEFRASANTLKNLLKGIPSAESAVTPSAILSAITLKGMRVADLARHFKVSDTTITQAVNSHGSGLKVARAGWVVQDIETAP
jgi:lambda repressor-like predicted transcriptional regulator